MEKSQLLGRIKSIITKADPNSRVYLFGSRANNTGKPDSDWDILILVDQDRITTDLETRINSLLYDLELETGEVISPFIYTENDWNSRQKSSPFYVSVMNHGQLL
jgi:predicted nucleotidyltransferase